ncbi:MAG TPA: hypothetical protein VEL76_26125 [Gemmataceae bacterium]|nr:hypothetical protein [Gemmataceae bacterium]
MNTGHGERLSRVQERAIMALLTQPTVLKAAEKIGVNEKTLRKWMQIPEFIDAWRAARREMFEGALGNLQALAGKAVRALEKNLRAERPADQIRAALGILEHGRKSAELEDLVRRVEELERRLANRHQQPAGQNGKAVP